MAKKRVVTNWKAEHQTAQVIFQQARLRYEEAYDSLQQAQSRLKMAEEVLGISPPEDKYS